MTALAVAACDKSSDDASGAAPSGDKAGNKPATAAATAHEAAAPAGGMDCSSAKKTIESQIALVQKGGSVDAFKECFTARQQGRITQAMVDKAHQEAAMYKLDELYDKEEPTKLDGQDAVKVKLKNGRTLTTLVNDGGKWRADTLWFK